MLRRSNNYARRPDLPLVGICGTSTDTHRLATFAKAPGHPVGGEPQERYRVDPRKRQEERPLRICRDDDFGLPSYALAENKGLALCRQDCSKRRISRFRLITTAFRSRYLDRLMRITATNQISTTCPSKPNIGRQRRGWVISRGPKGEMRPAEA